MSDERDRNDGAWSTTTPGHAPAMSTTLESPPGETPKNPQIEAQIDVQGAFARTPLAAAGQLEQTLESPGGAVPRSAIAPPPAADGAVPAFTAAAPPAYVPSSAIASGPPTEVRAIVVLDRVHGLDRAGVRGGARGGVAGLSAAFGGGVHAILGAPEDGTIALAELLSGARAPARGRVTVLDRDPRASALVRARIGVLAAQPSLPPAATVAAAVRMALRARGERDDRFDAVLDPLGLAPLHARAVHSLGYAEARAVELALALSLPAPVLVALHEPLADVAVPYPSVVRARIREIAASGACVVVTTSSPADARSLGDRVHVLLRGVIVLEGATGGGALDLGEGVELTAEVESGDGARHLVALLAYSASVRGVSWDQEANGRAIVRVRGVDLDACALALTDAAVEADVAIEAIAPTTQSLAAVRATADALIRLRVPRTAATPRGSSRAPDRSGGTRG